MMKKVILISLIIVSFTRFIYLNQEFHVTFDVEGVMTTPQAIYFIKEKGYVCLNCHAVETKVLGPAYQEVARRYKGKKEAELMLRERIKHGGIGHWGEIVPMPPNPTVTEDDLHRLVKWVLSL